MTFADLVAGDAVFVDANILTYYFQPHPTWGPPCTDLLRRIENQELVGFTSTHALSEVSHRLMALRNNKRGAFLTSHEPMNSMSICGVLTGKPF
jgi:predicted nucleic acid-binding protein